MATLVSLCTVASGFAFSAVAAAAPQAPVTLSPAKSIAATSAVLEGTLNPAMSAKAGWYFAYSTEFGCLIDPATTPVETEVEGKALREHLEVTGLQPSRTYTFCMIATDEAGEASPSSNEVSFITPASKPTVESEGSSGVSSTAATLEAQVNPNNQASVAYLQYSTSAAVNGSGSLEGVTQMPAPPGSALGSAYGGQLVGPVALTGLSAGSTYYYQAVATNETGVSYGAVQSFTTVPTPTTDPVSAIGATTATFNGHLTLNPVDTQYSFDYTAGTGCTGASSTPTGDAGTGAGSVFLTAGASELLPGTRYTVCLLASNAFGSELGSPVTFTTLAQAPAVESESAVDVTAESASLQAQVNPDGAETTYHFDYGTSEAYGQSTPESTVGAAVGGLPALVHLQGLQAAATYHYRVVATSVKGTVEGVDHTFTTQSPNTEFTLPDGRQWEMVTPPNKQGAGIIAPGDEIGSDIQASQNGDAIAYGTSSPLAANPAGNRALEVQQALSTRRLGAGGPSWETTDIATPHNEGALPLATAPAEYKLFSSDLSLGFVEPVGHTPLPPLPQGSEKTVYLRNNISGDYQALVTSANVPLGTKFGGEGTQSGGFEFVDATPDLSHIILQSKVPLTSNGIGPGLYEWTGGQLQLVSVLPNGEPSQGGLGNRKYVEFYRHAISNDGSRVIWAGNGERGHVPLFMRDMVRGETVQLGEEVDFETASEDASRVFFSSGELEAVGNLYVFEVTSGSGEPLAGRTIDLTGSGGLEGVIGASEDGSYIYFVDSGVLGDGAEEGAESGVDNLYMDHYEDGAKAWAPPTFIAALAGEDSPTWGGQRASGIVKLQDMNSRVSPNGRYLAFMSQMSLTGYDNRDASSGAPDEEVFLYDANTGRVVCASCNPTGARPAGLFVGGGGYEQLFAYNNADWENQWLAANIPTWAPEGGKSGSALYQPRYLSDSGRLFFNSPDALVPADVNGKADVYEYEQAGVGSCQPPGYGQSASVVFAEKTGGCVGLISAGTSSEESAFMDASENGEDTFFLTLSRLSPQDNDTNFDIYDAHECSSSSPCARAAALTPPPCSTGDACKAAPTPQPTIFGSPSSETFSGAGNPAALPAVVRSKPKAKHAKCNRGFRRDKNGKCVKKKRKAKAKKSAKGRK